MSCFFVGTTRLAVPLALLLSSHAALGAQEQDVEYIEIKKVRMPFRGDVPLQMQPQAVDLINENQLDNLAITDFTSALSLSAAVNHQNNFGGVWSSFAVRGFVGDENVPSGYLVNGFNAGRGFGGTRDMTNVQRIEVLKGPGSALFGRSEPGGTINIITKKPQFQREGYLQVSAGKWDQYRIEGDLTDAASDNLAFRINGAYEEKGSFRVPIDSKKTVLTPSLLWLVNEDTKISYELEYLEQELPFDRGIVALDGDANALPIDLFLGEPMDGPNNVDVLGHQITMEHSIKDWSLLTGFSYRDTELSGFSSDPELVQGRQLLFTDGQTLSRQHSFRKFSTSDYSGRLELSGSIDTYNIKHHLLFGTDFYHFNFDKYWLRYRPSPGQTDYTINIFNPEYGQTSPDMPLLYDQRETQENYGIYLQDQLDLTEKLKIQIGARLDDFDQTINNYKTSATSSQSHTAFSPRAGVVYNAFEGLSIYASYSKGFRPNTGADAQGDAFSPEESRSFEIGNKFEFRHLQGSVALFRADKSNILTADPINSGYSAALGKALSRGIEIELRGDITSQLNAGISYAYTHAQVDNDIVNADWGVEIPKGSRLINVPEHKGVLNIAYDDVIGGKRSTFGGTLIYVGKRLGETINPDYELSDYTLVNLYANINMTSDVSMQLNFSNIFDETYYPSSYSALWTAPGEPRSYRVSLRYDF